MAKINVTQHNKNVSYNKSVGKEDFVNMRKKLMDMQLATAENNKEYSAERLKMLQKQVAEQDKAIKERNAKLSDNEKITKSGLKTGAYNSLSAMLGGPLGVLLMNSPIGGRIKNLGGRAMSYAGKKLFGGMGNMAKSIWHGAGHNDSNGLTGARALDAKTEAAAPVNNLNKTVKKGFNDVVEAMGGKRGGKYDDKNSKGWLTKLLGLAGALLAGGLSKIGLGGVVDFLKLGIKGMFKQLGKWFVQGAWWVAKKAGSALWKALKFALSPLKRLGLKLLTVLGLDKLWKGVKGVGAKMLKAMGLDKLWKGVTKTLVKMFSKAKSILGIGGGKPIFDKSTGRWRDPKTGKFTKAPKGANKAAGKATSKVAGKAAGKAATKAAGKAAGKAAAKGAGKSLLKKLPGIGLLAGLAFGAGRLMDGDWKGALGEVTSGAASTIPGVGTAASLAIDAGLAARDIKNEMNAVPDEVGGSQAVAHSTGTYHTDTTQSNSATTSEESTQAALNAIIAALNKMNHNLSPDVQHELDREYLREMQSHAPAPGVNLLGGFYNGINSNYEGGVLSR